MVAILYPSVHGTISSDDLNEQFLKLKSSAEARAQELGLL